MPTIEDKEFGTITIRKIARSRSVRASVAPNGTLRISVPARAPMFMVKRMISGMRDDLRDLLSTRPVVDIIDGAGIGKSHVMIVRRGSTELAKVNGLRLTVNVRDDQPSDELRAVVRSKIVSILRKEAKHHLPKRIKYLAEQHGFSYSSLRFTHSSSRWGSCNSNKSISLNIALMNLPFELIDYVLIHELSHTVHLNHSKDFWSEVEQADPDYLQHRRMLKQHNPAI